MKVRFVKIKNNHNALRDDVIEGVTSALPKEGESFCLQAEPKDPSASVRLVNTSVVSKVEQLDNEYTFTTRSGSLYKVIVLE